MIHMHFEAVGLYGPAAVAVRVLSGNQSGVGSSLIFFKEKFRYKKIIVDLKRMQ